MEEETKRTSTSVKSEDIKEDEEGEKVYKLILRSLVNVSWVK